MHRQWVNAEDVKKGDVILVGAGHRAQVYDAPYRDPEEGYLLRVPYRFEDCAYQGEDHDYYRARPGRAFCLVTDTPTRND